MLFNFEYRFSSRVYLFYPLAVYQRYQQIHTRHASKSCSLSVLHTGTTQVLLTSEPPPFRSPRPALLTN